MWRASLAHAVSYVCGYARLPQFTSIYRFYAYAHTMLYIHSHTYTQTHKHTATGAAKYLNVVCLYKKNKWTFVFLITDLKFKATPTDSQFMHCKTSIVGAFDIKNVFLKEESKMRKKNTKKKCKKFVIRLHTYDTVTHNNRNAIL